MTTTTNISRRVSYILPSPSQPPPLLALPGLGERRRGTTAPCLMPKHDDGVNGHAKVNGHSDNNGGWAPAEQDPFADDQSPYTNISVPVPAARKSEHPRHCLGITSLAIDTSTVLSDSSVPGGILYSGGRDGLVASWDLGITHSRRRGGRYEVQPGRGGRVRWEKVGDGAEMWDEDEDDEEMDGENGANGDYDEWESDEEEVVPDGGWLGVDPDRIGHGLSKRRSDRGGVPYEDRWEVDAEALAQAKPPPTVFRQSAQTHTDWVNAMLLCNLNQTVITASSDRTIQAWSPHSTTSTAPVLVGRHRDYVKSLAWAKYPSLLFSGALDRQIAIWDVGAPNHEMPLLNIDLNKADEWGGVGLEGERGSVYALGVDPTGRLLAAGTPERVVRMWDPRVGDKSIGKLIGHSDCVRSVVVSDDGKHMLTGSSDSTIKLWSLAALRCLHTFNHHTSSVWSLFSNHPNLERFYSGSRDGILAAVDVEQVGDISDGECVVLAREGAIEGKRGDYESKSGDEGIRCIVGMDDEYVWTATGSAEIKRWKDVGRRVKRWSKEDDGGAYSRRQSIGDVVPPPPGVAGLDQPFNLSQVPETAIKNRRLSLDGETSGGLPLDRTESTGSRAVAFAPPPNPRETSSPGGPNGSPGGLAVPQSTRDRLNGQDRRTTLSGASVAGSVMSDMSGNEEGGRRSAGTGINGIPYDSLVSLGIPDSPYAFGFGHGAHRSGDMHDARSISSGRHLKAENDLKTPNQRARDEYEDREVASEALPLRKQPDEVIAGRPGLVRSIILNDRQHVLTVDTDGEVAVWNIVKGVAVGRFCVTDVASAFHLERGVDPETAVRKHSVEVLELVKNRIEGETMVITWCAVDTKIGSLVIHLEEGRVFDAEVYADESGVPGLEHAREDIRLNLGKWALANLFKGLISAEEREVVQNSPSTTHSSLPPMPRSPEIRSIPLDRGTAAHPHRSRALSGTFANQSSPSLNIPGLATPAARTAIVPDEDLLSKSAPAAGSGWQSFHALRSGAMPSIAQSPAVSLGGSGAAQSPAENGGRDYFSLGRRRDPSPSRGEDRQPPTPGSVSAAVPPTPATPGGGKLKLKFGKKKKDTAAMEPVAEAKEVVAEDLGPKVPEREAEQLRILDTVRSHPFHPPSAQDAPPVALPPDTAVLISEESKDAGAWVVTYRSRVGSTEEDMVPLEMNSPLWLLDYLFTGRTKVKDPVKLTFILEPVPGCGLKEMPEGTTRLSASRILRTRKIMSFIYDKLELSSRKSGSLATAQSRISSLANRLASNPPPVPGQASITEHTPAQANENSPEDAIELLCGDHVVDPKMTLATLKQYYGSGGDMLLLYRPRKGSQLV